MSGLFSTSLLDKSLYDGKEVLGLRVRGGCAPKSTCLESALHHCVLLSKGAIRASLRAD